MIEKLITGEEAATTRQPKIGWFSVYTPEEIIYAAGLVPFRITGESAPSSIKARALLFSNICPYTLSCLEEGIQGLYRSLDGIAIVNTCDARRRLYDAWRRYVKTPFVQIIDLPKIITPESRIYFKNQFIRFKEAIEGHFKVQIGEKPLKSAISLWNQTRLLLEQLYELRKMPTPPITGSETLAIVKASMAGERENFNERLDRLLQELNNIPKRVQTKKKRILITGSYFDQLSLINMIEKLGAVVVCEDLSNGLKYFEGTVDINKEPLEALADYYLEKSPCARMADSDKRAENILQLVRDYKADAVIYFALKFCDSNLMDFPYQKDRLNKAGVPVLFIEGERVLVNLSQLKTRIQAFLEIN